MESYLIIGLGNPGTAYQNTRHNVGFQIVQAFAEKLGAPLKQTAHLNGELASAQIDDKKVLLLRPMTYMNTSGEAVRRCVDYFKVPLDQLIVVCDDVALPIGTIRMRSKGSCGGHNGLKSIEAHLNTEHYARLRIGVSGPGDQVLADYVLGRFTQDEKKIVEDVLVKAIQALEMWVAQGIPAAMQMANKKEEEGENNG